MENQENLQEIEREDAQYHDAGVIDNAYRVSRLDQEISEDIDDSDDDLNWRNWCEDGSVFGLNPSKFMNEIEYLAALLKAKHSWRNDCEDAYEFDIDPEDYETWQEYEAALMEAKFLCGDDECDEFGYDDDIYHEDEY